MDVCKVVGMSCSVRSGRRPIGVRLGLRLLMYVFLALHCSRDFNQREAGGFRQSWKAVSLHCI